MFKNVACQNDDRDHFVGFVGFCFQGALHQILPSNIVYECQSAWRYERHTNEYQVLDELSSWISCFQVIHTVNVFFVAWKNAENIESLKTNPESLKYKHVECT